MKSFEDIGRTLTQRSPLYRNVTRDEEQARELRRLVRRAIDMKPTDTAVLEDIDRAIKATGQIMDIRGGFDSGHPLYDDPLAITKVFAELRKAGAPPVKVPTLLAAIMAPVLRLKRKSETDPIDHTDEDFKKDVEIIQTCLDMIGGKTIPIEQLRKNNMEKLSIGFSREVAAATELTTRDTLQLSEINLGQSIRRIQPAVANGKPAEKSEQDCLQSQHVKAFLHMVMEPIGTERNRDPESVLTRGAMWLIFMEQLEKKMAEDRSPRNDQRLERCAALTEQVYIPLVTAYGHDVLVVKFKDQLAKMLHGGDYEQVYNATVKGAQKTVPRKLRQHITDMHTAQKIAIRNLAHEVFELIPAEYRPMCTIEGRIKKPYDILDKRVRKPGEKITDHNGLRIIVNVPFAENETSDNIWREEHKACSHIYAAIDRAASKGQILGLIPEEVEYRKQIREAREERRKKNGNDKRKNKSNHEPRPNIPYTGKHKDFYAQPKDNGYRAIKNKYIIPEEGAPKADEFPRIGVPPRDEAPILALQIVGAVAHWNNEHGTAAHDGVYKNPGLKKSVDTTAQHTVSVFNRNNRIVELTRGATVADFLAAIDPDVAFSASGFTIERTVNYFSSSLQPPDNKLTTPLVTGDRIGYSTRPDLICNEDHRREVVMACQTKASRDTLNKYHLELMLKVDGNYRPKTNGAPKGWVSDAKPK